MFNPIGNANYFQSCECKLENIAVECGYHYYPTRRMHDIYLI